MAIHRYLPHFLVIFERFSIKYAIIIFPGKISEWDFQSVIYIYKESYTKMLISFVLEFCLGSLTSLLD